MVAAAGLSGFDLACTLVNAMSEKHGVKNNYGIKIIVSHDRHAACVQDLIRASLDHVCSPHNCVLYGFTTHTTRCENDAKKSAFVLHSLPFS